MKNKDDQNIKAFQAKDVPFAHGLTLQDVQNVRMSLLFFAKASTREVMTADLEREAAMLERALERAARRYAEDVLRVEDASEMQVKQVPSDALDDIVKEAIRQREREGAEPEPQKPRDDN